MREIGSRDVGESRPESTRCPLGDLDGFPRLPHGFWRYQRLTVRPCATCTHEIDATQPIGMIGIGLEHRWRHLALQGELRGIGMGKAKDDHASDSVPTAMSTVTTTDSAHIERSGASLTVGLSYYFYPNTSCTTTTCR